MTILGPDPLEEQLETALRMLSQGITPEAVESTQIDVKEERGRRINGKVQAGKTENEDAARQLAGELACMANTKGGGAIILGIANDGSRIGTRLDCDWLRHRIWELTGEKLEARVREANLGGTRLLVLSVPQSFAPIYHGGKLRWRVGSNCVEINPTLWHQEDLRRRAYDWSAQPSGHTLESVAAFAVEIARSFLRQGDNRTELVNASPNDLLRRLNLVDGNGRLTNAGSLLFVETPGEGLDYLRREISGGDSTNRVRGDGRPLIVQYYEVEKAGEAVNRLIHVPRRASVHRQIRAIPPTAFREAIVNGITHRDWLSPHSTFIEHVGDRLVVTSPGGFPPEISAENIITHPPRPRYRSLSKAMAALGLAEAEGFGVDRMVIETLALGHGRPEFEEIEGPAVKVTLFGGDPDTEVIDMLSSLEPIGMSKDVDLLLVLDYLGTRGWVDTSLAASATQRNMREAQDILDRIHTVTLAGKPLVVAVKGSPPDPSQAYRLSDQTREILTNSVTRFDTPDTRKSLILHWARGRGRVSSTEVADLSGVTPSYAGRLLTDLEEEGLLARSRDLKRGRGFHYLPTSTEHSEPYSVMKDLLATIVDVVELSKKRGDR